MAEESRFSKLEKAIHELKEQRVSLEAKLVQFDVNVKNLEAMILKVPFFDGEGLFDDRGFSLFLSVVHHYIQNLSNVRSDVQAYKEELENLRGKEEKATKEIEQLEEVFTLSESLKKIKLECEEKDKRVETAEAHVASLQKLNGDLLLEYYRLSKALERQPKLPDSNTRTEVLRKDSATHIHLVSNFFLLNITPTLLETKS